MTGEKGKEHYYEAKAPTNKHVDQYLLSLSQLDVNSGF
jgi:hypothetical protein